MAAEQAFEFGSIVALFGWVCLILGALINKLNARKWLLLFGGRVIPAILSILYAVLVVLFLNSAPEGGYSSLDEVSKLFESEGNLASGWIHFLAFDLLVARWMIDEVEKHQYPVWILVPCIPITFLYGPAGFLLFLTACLPKRFFIKSDSNK